MIIKSIEPHLLSCPLPEPAVYPFHGGQRTIYKRDAMVVRIEMEDGTVGYGPGPASEDHGRKIEKEISPRLVGTKLSDPSNFVEKLVDKEGILFGRLREQSRWLFLIYGEKLINVR